MVKLFEAFSGYGSQGIAADVYGLDFEIVGIAEIDKYAIAAHKSLHGDVKNYGDVSKLSVDELPDMDLFTYSFPCQDISNAGLQRGLEKGSGTRSSLLWECERIIDNKRPKYLMMENVKNLVGKKNKPFFDTWLKVLEDLGYNNYWKVINAKWCGVPQNRERVFCVSILEEFDNGQFHFEENFDNGIRLKDILEDKVDEKYYLSEKMLEKISFREQGKSDIHIIGHSGSGGQKGYIHKIDGIVVALSATDYKQPKQLVKEATKKGYKEAYEGDSINLEQLNFKTRRGRVGNQVANTLTTSCNQAVVDEKYYLYEEKTNNLIQMANQLGCNGPDEISKTIRVGGHNSLTKKHNWDHINDGIRIRKLTPKECFRLMGLDDEDIDKIQAIIVNKKPISNSQQYKLAGNSIVVDCMKFLKNLPNIKGCE